ncbi:MAG: helix-turn-helix domain-containing protein [Planctomycetes bacterium]|nr:helix-turn-helix domain-containing protein [Planctomycetota bacterium]
MIAMKPDKITSNLHKNNERASPRLVRIRELSNYVGLTVSNLYVMVSKQTIPYVKIGRRTMFDLQEIDQWIKERSVPVQPK